MGMNLPGFKVSCFEIFKLLCLSNLRGILEHSSRNSLSLELLSLSLLIYFSDRELSLTMTQKDLVVCHVAQVTQCRRYVHALILNFFTLA